MRVFFTTILFFLPVLVRAQVTLQTILSDMTDVVRVFVPVAISIALLVFVWGLVRMMAGLSYGDSDKAIEFGKKRMVWGVVGLFLIVSVWGIVELLMVVFGTNVGSMENPPVINSFIY